MGGGAAAAAAATGQQDDEVLFELKVIPFFGRDVSIILQNANGPCPLLAIANALLLRNQINLPARCITVGNIHIQQLLSIVAEHMLDANKETKQLQVSVLDRQNEQGSAGGLRLSSIILYLGSLPYTAFFFLFFFVRVLFYFVFVAT